MHREFLFGLLAARSGNQDIALRQVGMLRRTNPSDSLARLAVALGRSLQALILWRQGNAAAALVEIEAAVPAIPLHVAITPLGSRSWERFMRAELLLLAGRKDEALRWYKSMGENSPYDLVFWGPALLRMAEISEREGNLSDARLRLRQFQQAWAGADPPLRRIVDSVAARLRGLGSPSR